MKKRNSTPAVPPTSCHPDLPLLKSLYPSRAAPQPCELSQPTPPLGSQWDHSTAITHRNPTPPAFLHSAFLHITVQTPSQADFSKCESFPHNALLDLCVYTWDGHPPAPFVVFMVAPVYNTPPSSPTHLIYYFLTWFGFAVSHIFPALTLYSLCWLPCWEICFCPIFASYSPPFHIPQYPYQKVSSPMQAFSTSSS